ncbi:MAG: hypothetical protein NVSMB9_20790 [Isosphaeraceae bacterium]
MLSQERLPTRLRIQAGVAFFCLLAFLGKESRAQHTPDPYNIVGDYNRQYEPYMYATYPNTESSMPNQGRLEERVAPRTGSQFQLSLDGSDAENLTRTAPSRLQGPGVPYYRANRQFDQEFQRQYRPNDSADRGFYSNQQQMNSRYFQALRETDPKKRVELLRQYNLENVRSSRTLSGARNAAPRDAKSSKNRFDTHSILDPSDEATPVDPETSNAAPPPRRVGSPNAGTRPSAMDRSRAEERSGSSYRPAPTRNGVRGRPSESIVPFGSDSGTRRPGPMDGTRPRSSSGSIVPFGSDSSNRLFEGPNSGQSATETLERSRLYDRARRAATPSRGRPTDAPAPR